MSELSPYDVFGISNLSLSEYLTMAAGYIPTEPLDALQTASLLADAPDYLYNEVYAYLDSIGAFYTPTEADLEIINKWNANAINKNPAEVAAELSSKHAIDVEVIASNSGDTLTITNRQLLTSGNSAKDSNAPIVRRPIDTEIDSEGNVKFSARAGLNKAGEAVLGFAGYLSSAVAIVSASIICGKLIEEGIYHTGKLFGVDVTKFDRKVWSNLGSWDSAIGVPLIDAIFEKFDPHDPNIVAYVSDDVLLSSIDYLDSLGAFNQSYYISIPEGVVFPPDLYGTITQNINGYDSLPYTASWNTKDSSGKIIRSHAIDVDVNSSIFKGKIGISLERVYNEAGEVSEVNYVLVYSTTNPSELTSNNGITETHTVRDSAGVITQISSRNTNISYDGVTKYYSYTYDGKTAYYVYKEIAVEGAADPDSSNRQLNYPSETVFIQSASFLTTKKSGMSNMANYGPFAWLLLYGNKEFNTANSNIKNQNNANILNFLGGESQQERYSIVKNKYAHLWDNGFTRSILQPDGTVSKKTYVPIPIPNSESITSSKVLPGDASNNATEVTNPDTLGDISGIIAKKQDPSDNQPGDGGVTPEPTIPVVPPTSLWAVYNPSQSEVDEFGSWLWSSDPIEQIKKIFNDPAQGIIGIHKVFASPNVAGRREIKVGYLSSNVNSNYVGAQYSSVDCGTINVNESFGNVFDYMPYTRVQCYLPFIGVVELDSNDIMRGSVNVTYGVDVLTGDCLANISVERDGAGGILYSFPGNCAVRYPFSTGSYMSIIGYGAGALATIATGNIGMFGAVSNIFGSRPTIQHGGSFAGNPGATGPKIPYLIITRPQQALARKFNEFEGYPTNYTTQIGLCKGFIKVKEVHLSNITATDDELTMIEELLKDGVIVQSN